jgi:hypothetical protein
LIVQCAFCISHRNLGVVDLCMETCDCSRQVCAVAAPTVIGPQERPKAAIFFIAALCLLISGSQKDEEECSIYMVSSNCSAKTVPQRLFVLSSYSPRTQNIVRGKRCWTDVCRKRCRRSSHDKQVSEVFRDGRKFAHLLALPRGSVTCHGATLHKSLRTCWRCGLIPEFLLCDCHSFIRD